MRRLLMWSQAHPVAVVCILLVGSILSSLRLSELRLDASSKELMIRNDPDMVHYQDTVATFGTDSVLVIYVRDSKLFSPAKLAALEHLVNALSELPGVIKTESLFSVSHVKSVDGLLETGPLMDWPPDTEEECREKLADALRNPLYHRNLISESGTVTAINLFLEPHPQDRNFNIDISTGVDAVLDVLGSPFEETFQIGTPYTWRMITHMLRVDQHTLVPLSVLVLLFMLMVTMRSVSGAVLPLITAGISVFWTLGFMAWTGTPLNILTIIVPSLIIVLGSTEDIHLLAEYEEGFKQEGARDRAVRHMAAKVGTAVLLTALTTFLGFLSISINRINMLKQFGAAASFGLFVNPIVTCMVAPVYLRFFGSTRTGKGERGSRLDKALDALADVVLRTILEHKRAVLWSFLGCAAVFASLSFKLKVDNDLLGFFRSNSPIIRRVNALHRDLAGAQLFYVRISSGFADTFKQPASLRQTARVQQFLEQQQGVDKVISLADHVRVIHREMNEGAHEHYSVPDSGELIAQYLLFLQRGDIERYVSADYSETNLVVRHNINSSHELRQLLKRCEQEIPLLLNPHFKVRFTGENILINKAADTIAKGQAKSILLLLGVIFIIMSILFVNFKASLLSLIPNVFPIAINFGIMVLLDIPLNSGTCMVAAIAIGLALDDTIHFMSRYNSEMRTLRSEKKAVVECFRAEFKPVLATSIALSLGFVVLCFSNFMPIAHFGLLSALVMISALLGDLFITPILLSNTKLLTLWDMLGLKLQADVVERSELFRELRPWQIKKVVLLGRIFTRQAEQYIYRELDKGDSMFLILEGDVRLLGVDDRSGQEVAYARLAPSDVCGEINLLDPGTRAESAKAVSDVRYVEFTRDDLQRLYRLYPRTAARVYKNLARLLGHRLAVTSWMYRESKTNSSETA